ncbi:MAG: hypothetical protein IPJ06_16495 [Saprospiraceae bacterium]|nr:hypothetical protein [Saprospiraceae bacterium]
MLHPDHVFPLADIDPNKLAWLSWWQDRRRDLVNHRHTDMFMLVFAGLIFAFTWLDGEVHWGRYAGGCLFLILAVIFFYRRRTVNVVQEWEEIGQLPYVDQCRVVREKLMAEGKPGWFHFWYLVGFPVFWVVFHMPRLDLVWTSDMTDNLILGMVTGVALNFFYQYQRRAQWQKGMDLANIAVSA